SVLLLFSFVRVPGAWRWSLWECNTSSPSSGRRSVPGSGYQVLVQDPWCWDHPDFCRMIAGKATPRRSASHIPCWLSGPRCSREEKENLPSTKYSITKYPLQILGTSFKYLRSSFASACALLAASFLL